MAAPEVYRDIRPLIPTAYAGDQARFDRDYQVLQVRRELLERAAAIRESRALILIHEADALERWQRLRADTELAATDPGPRSPLTPAQRQRVTGQALLAQARVEHLTELIQQLTLEAQAWAATLVPTSPEGSP